MLLSVEDLTCGYPGRRVLTNVTFSVSAGEVVVLLGPNGSGKSTLLKTLVFSIPPLAGRVCHAGADAARMSPREIARCVAFVPQEELPTFPFTVRQVVMMGRLPHSSGLSDSAPDAEAVERAMTDADCAPLADRPVTEVSGGERQRALIARALASEAPLLLLDEPSSHLDAAHVVHLVALLRRLAEGGRAVVAAVHDLNVAAVLGHRALLIGSGKVVCDEPVADVLASPALEEVYGVPFERHRDSRGILRVFPL